MSPLENLPDEVILNILGYVKIQDLIICGQLSNRLRCITQDPTLWQRVDVNDKKISTKFLEMILGKGCRFLDISLCQTLEETLTLERRRSELRHLDVSCFPATQVLQTLILSCHLLEKLSMRNMVLWPNMLLDICHQNGQTLKILNLRNCEGTNSHIDRDLDFESVKIITDFCKNLREIDFSGSIGSTNSGDSIRYLVNNITTNIEKIDFGNVTNIDDDDVRILVQRCQKISTLNLDYTNITNGALDSLINEGRNIEELSVSFCNTVAIQDKILELGFMPKLRVLNCSYEEVGTLREIVPHLLINKTEIRIAKFWISKPWLSHGRSVVRN